MKKLTFGLIAHVDCGKTTLSEALLFKAGAIRKFGRVDHKDTEVDNEKIERERGITIFTKEASFEYGSTLCTLIDTPGHVDFSKEMERALGILDIAVLIINGAEGLDDHSLKLFELIKGYNLPCIVFVNKMDLVSADKEKLISELSEKLGDKVADILDLDSLAMTSQNLMDEYIEKSTISDESLIDNMKRKELYPLVFGSALKQEGVETLLSLLLKFGEEKNDDGAFNAKVYKISYDEKGRRLTHAKILSGKIALKESINDEKVNEIRRYVGTKYENLKSACAGDVISFSGLTKSFADEISLVNLPVKTYEVRPGKGGSISALADALEKFSFEMPELEVYISAGLSLILVSICGEIQLEVLKQLFIDRYRMMPEFQIYVEPELDLEEEVIEEERVLTEVSEFKLKDHYDSKLDEEKDLIRIFEHTFGKIEERNYALESYKKPNQGSSSSKWSRLEKLGYDRPVETSNGEALPTYLLIDGYNIIFAWDDLKKLSDESLDLARETLINRVASYKAMTNYEIILVFDAYKIKGQEREDEEIHGINVIYTKEAETADSYIERTSRVLSKKYKVRVASSDYLEQIIILGSGANRISADEFRKEVEACEERMRRLLKEKSGNFSNSIEDATVIQSKTRQ